jgi:hypothetical protein
VSFSALLRIRHGDRYVLFDSLSRPGSYGPPGGVIKFFPPATSILEQLGFQQETRTLHSEPTGLDLRGLVPARSAHDFLEWFETGAYRENAIESVRRELDEELAEVGLTSARVDTHALDFRLVRTVIEGPDAVSHRNFLQLRRFEIFDLVTTDTVALDFVRTLAAAGADPAFPGAVYASPDDIEHGRCGPALLAPHCAFLIGDRRFAPDLPSVR